MNRQIPFTKMHGAGNDYIYVDTSRYTIDYPAETARCWSNRHTGIGADGLVMIGRPSDSSINIFKKQFSPAVFRMNHRNFANRK